MLGWTHTKMTGDEKIFIFRVLKRYIRQIIRLLGFLFFKLFLGFQARVVGQTVTTTVVNPVCIYLCCILIIYLLFMCFSPSYLYFDMHLIEVLYA